MAPILEQGTAELIGVIQIINNKAGVPFGTPGATNMVRIALVGPEAAGRG